MYLMKNTFHRIFSVFMALVVMMSTASFTVDKHYCGKALVDMAVFSEAETCGMEMNKPFDSAVTDANSNGDFCCSNHKTTVEGQDELASSIKSLDFGQQVFLSTFTYSYVNLFRHSPEHIVLSKHYSSPLLIRDVQLLDQVFLI